MSYFGIPLRNGVGVGLGNAVAVNTSPIKGGPTLSLSFLDGTLDPRITFTRSTTATYTNSAGAIATAAINAPRFTYNPVTLAPQGLLIEEQRTNLLLYSEQFDAIVWTKINVSITANATIAPDGASTADKVVENTTANAAHNLQNTSGTGLLVNGVESIYLKAAERSKVLMYDAVAAKGVGFDLSNGTTFTVSGISLAATYSITTVGNGWYRCDLAATNAADIRVYLCDASGAFSYTGNGTSGIYIWGAQLEAGAFATSYIPTTIAQVTRTADNASMTGTNFSSWYNASEGSFFTNINIVGTSAYPVIPITYQSAAANANNLGFAASGNQLIFAGRTSAANQSATYNTTIPFNGKLAGAYKANDLVAVKNGIVTGTDTTGTPPTVDAFCIAGVQVPYWQATNGQIYIKSIIYYPRRLSNTELQVITA